MVPLELVALETLQELHVQWRGTMSLGCSMGVHEPRDGARKQFSSELNRYIDIILLNHSL
jgi:hypothetical protein